MLAIFRACRNVTSPSSTTHIYIYDHARPIIVVIVTFAHNHRHITKLMQRSYTTFNVGKRRRRRSGIILYFYLQQTKISFPSSSTQPMIQHSMIIMIISKAPAVQTGEKESGHSQKMASPTSSYSFLLLIYNSIRHSVSSYCWGDFVPSWVEGSRSEKGGDDTRYPFEFFFTRIRIHTQKFYMRAFLCCGSGGVYSGEGL